MDTPVKGLAGALPMEDVGLAASQALTDTMVERLVTTVSHGMEVLDRLNDDDTREAVHSAIDGLTNMHTTGALDAVFELAQILQAGRAAITDQMVERLYHFAETMVTSLGTQEIATLAKDAELSFYDAARISEEPTAPKGMWSMLRALSKPETVQTLNLLVEFGNCLRERSKGFDGRMEPEPSQVEAMERAATPN